MTPFLLTCAIFALLCLPGFGRLPAFRRPSDKAAVALGIALVREVLPGRLDAADESVDVVLSTLVLCSVPDAEAVVRDVRRVLAPGGRFVFIEHVAAPPGTRLRRAQDLLRPFWEFMADGCQPNRELASAIQRGGFAAVEIDQFRAPPEAAVGIVAPHIAGVAAK